MNSGFLPVSRGETDALGWSEPDFVYVTGDAYVDHPSFGVAIISRVLEDKGFKVAILAQPDWRTADDFRRFGRPRLGFLVTGGNIDSMVAHYTVSKKRRSYDYYSPGGKTGLRPDRAVIVYCNRIREAYGDIPILIGGLEASLRRFAHYDYWSDRVRRSILYDSGADLLMYGMGENIITAVAKLLDRGVPIKKIRNIKGTAVLTEKDYVPKDEHIFLGDFETLRSDKEAYANAFRMQYDNTCPKTGKVLIEDYGDRLLIQNPPMPTLTRAELDRVYALPYMRDYHPMYKKDGGVPAISEVKFSVTHNRGCFGGCSFCALAFHQGREVVSRSVQSVVDEVKKLAEMPDFKGYINDVGGPTANFRHMSCEKAERSGVCKDRRCLAPTPCPNLNADESEYVELLREIEKVTGVRKVFIRSGIRFDYMMCDKSDEFFRKLVRDHVSGQLKVAPEHCSNTVLSLMGKPNIEIFEKFKKRYFELSREYGKEQYLVPYLMSSHPGSTLKEAQALERYISDWGYQPEQVQDFYPTPGTASTCMFYTGINPFDSKRVYVPTDPKEKELQRALLQPNKPKNRAVIAAAYHSGVLKAPREKQTADASKNHGRRTKPKGKKK